MLFKYLQADIPIDDDEFDRIYPNPLDEVSYLHFTPIEVARSAAEFLVSAPGMKVLDIGSGVGKFCMIGASYTDGHFTGVEYRKSLHDISNLIGKKYELENLVFLHENMLNIRFEDYEAFYFYNAFYENIPPHESITNEVELSETHYSEYSAYVREQLNRMPMGTRLATYHESDSIVPDSYVCSASEFDEKLKLWIKTK